MFYRFGIGALSVLIICTTIPAHGYEYTIGRTTFKLNGYATGGILEPDFNKTEFIGDWRVRGEMNFDATENTTLGAVFAMDANAVDDKKYMREGFVFMQYKTLGRTEVGFTDSIARKLGIGLPDVGGLRINDKPLFYKKIKPLGPVIADTTMTTGRRALRLNVASVPVSGVQYGISVAGITDDYDYTIDAGLKIRQPNGKMKLAYSLGASFMGNPNGYCTDSYNPDVNADWRAQLTGGMNIQYKSWMFGLTTRLIYDHNPIGNVSDGLVVGTGVSYDILNYSLSLTYLFSDTGIWERNAPDYADHTVVGSFRYKYSQNVDCWMSLGMTTKTPFLSVGLRFTF